jgi:3-oxoacyl-(acyl-carrier-protein) synthase
VGRDGGRSTAFVKPVANDLAGSRGAGTAIPLGVEAIFTILALQRGVLPPTINQTTPDSECDLDYIPNEARSEQVEIGVSNSFGFGGHNSCLVMRRWAG